MNYRELAKQIAGAGRGGDTELAHVNQREINMLLRAGGAGSRNPKTGLLEFMDGGSYSGNSEGSDSGGNGNAAGAGGNRNTDSSSGAFSADIAAPAGSPGGLSSTMIGQLSDLKQKDNAAVGQLSGSGTQLSGVNAASDVMHSPSPTTFTGGDPRGEPGQLGTDTSGLASPSVLSRVKDFVGINNPGGFLGSNAARTLATLIGSIFGGPFGSMGAGAAVGAAQGRAPSDVMGGIISNVAGSVLGIPTFGLANPASFLANNTDPNAQVDTASVKAGGEGSTASVPAAAPTVVASTADTAAAAPAPAVAPASTTPPSAAAKLGLSENEYAYLQRQGIFV
jgi:hypothetical protein